jgi:plasmid stabilization system protein ParE
MIRICWTPLAAADLRQISDYLKEHYPHYRDPTIRKIYSSIQTLKKWPHSGRPGREEGHASFRLRLSPTSPSIVSAARASKFCAFITVRGTDYSACNAAKVAS